MIFSLCVELQEHPSNIHPALTISHTCSVWRAISVEHPTMWSRVNLSQLSPASAELVLGRGRAVPLRIVGCDVSTRRDVTALISDHCHRLEELHIQITPNNDTATMVVGIPAVAYPSLRRVSLHLPLSSSSLSGSAHIAIIPTPLFDCNAPQLRCLSLVGVRLPFLSGRYRNLSTLKIARGDPLGANDDDICWVLRESPNLEMLEIDLLITRTRGPATGIFLGRAVTRHPPTLLSRLRTVRLSMPLVIAHRLLSSIYSDSVEVLEIRLTGPQHHRYKPSDLLELPSGLRPSRVFQDLDVISADVQANRTDQGVGEYNSIRVASSIFAKSGHGTSRTFSLDWLEWPSQTPEMLPGVIKAIQSYHDMPKLRFVWLSSNQPRSRPSLNWAAFGALALLSHGGFLALSNAAHHCITSRQPQDTIPISGSPSFDPKVIKMKGEIHHDEVQRLWEWCWKLENLYKFDMSLSIMQCYTMEQGLAFVRQVSLRRNIRNFVWPLFRFWDPSTGMFGQPRDMSEEWSSLR